MSPGREREKAAGCWEEEKAAGSEIPEDGACWNMEDRTGILKLGTRT